MVALPLSGTVLRLIGVLVLMPIIMIIWSDVKIASIVIAILGTGMAFELNKILKMPVIMATALTLLISLQSFPVWMFDVGVAWHSGLAAVSFGITLAYRGFLAGLYALALSICLYFSAILLDQTDGHWLLLLLAAVVAACDSAAYFVGRTIGGAKLAPSVSPNKTVSGSVGGVIAAVVVMTGLNCIPALAQIAGLEPFTRLDLVNALFLGSSIAILSQIGDLLESALKRSLNVKDRLSRSSRTNVTSNYFAVSISYSNVIRFIHFKSSNHS